MACCAFDQLSEVHLQVCHPTHLSLPYMPCIAYPMHMRKMSILIFQNISLLSLHTGLAASSYAMNASALAVVS